MNKKDFFDAVSEWKEECMSIERHQILELRELLRKNIQDLTTKDRDEILIHVLEQLVLGSHNRPDVDKLLKRYDPTE